ncbi:MAG: threonine ammonia-lyase IlvA [Chitinophagales bacterium]|nr:threonine ammonia-lyase IlvA [Chitinophagales bacterium]MCZ2394056.1 threonine ammonia-lyase IlvA [Chitinophagales bacterium]
MSSLPTYEGILQAAKVLEGVTSVTPLQFNTNLSETYQANIWLKREDLQIVRSYKIRGAYNFISNLSEEDRKKGVVCSSAGNHAQGVAFSCQTLKIKGVIFMPATTPKQKVRAVQRLGREWVEIVLSGDTYDDAKSASIKYAAEHQCVMVSPFDDKLIIEGQATVGLEIAQQLKHHEPDYFFVPVGGGGLISGLTIFLKTKYPKAKIIAVEPQGAASLKASIDFGSIVTLNTIDNFVDGAAVKQIGTIPFEVLKSYGLDDIVIVPEGAVCTSILQLYNRNAIVAEPAGALSVAALNFYTEQIKGKNVVCILSGGNNDIERMPDIKERSLIYEGLKHYFMVSFPQRSGALKEFVNDILGPDDDITSFTYTKKNNKESGPALVGVELKQKEDYQSLLDRMDKYGIKYICINEDPLLFNLLI